LTARRAAQNKKLQNLFKRKKNIFFFFLSVLLFSIGESVPLLTARSGPKRWGGQATANGLGSAHITERRGSIVYFLFDFFFLFSFFGQ
jgi:hypothetical protein